MGKTEEEILALARQMAARIDQVMAEEERREKALQEALRVLNDGLREILRVSDLVEQHQRAISHELQGVRNAIGAAGEASAAKLTEAHEAVVGEIVEARARIADAELAILDAYLRTQGPPRAPVEVTRRD